MPAPSAYAVLHAIDGAEFPILRADVCAFRWDSRRNRSVVYLKSGMVVYVRETKAEIAAAVGL